MLRGQSPRLNPLSDDFDRVKRYLIQDATTYAQTPRDKFYAFSAHPSKNTDTLTPDKVFGQSSDPMLDFQLGWFNNSNYFPSFVEEMMENYSSLVLNSISTDFVGLSGSFELTMRLQSFCNTTTTTQTTSTATMTTATITTSEGLTSGANTEMSGCINIFLPLWSLVASLGLLSA
ncbi:plcxd1 [Symbiodinium sp. CCMP2456]|nr:plcxd1 [Symbiodinium sp. CCMP2456]